MNRRAVQQAAAWYFSASQLSNAEDCIRIWAWEKICGLVEPSGPAAALGTETHFVLEGWLGKGTPPNPHTRVGQIAIPGLRHLPYPGPELEIEREFHVRIGDFHYRGKVDVGFVDATGMPWVIDHKTTGDFCWKLTPEDLLNNIQGLMYAKQALDRYGVDEVHLRWVYYHSRKPFKSEPTDLRVTRAQVDQRWPVIDDLARKIDKVRLTVVDPLTLPPNTKSCSKYGGCPHIKRCNLTAQQSMSSIMTQQSIRERMQSRVQQREQGTTPAAVPAVAPPANQPPPVPVAQPAPVAALPVAVQPAPVAAAPPVAVQPAPVAAAPPVAVQQVPVAVQPAPVAAAPPVAVQPAPVAAVPPVAVQPVQAAAVPPVAVAAPVAQFPPVQQQLPVAPQQVVPMNPPEQPPMEVQLSSTVTEEQVAPGARANEDEATAATPKTKKPRAKKPTGFIVEDRRTALLLSYIASVASGGPTELTAAHQFIATWYPET